MLNRSGKEEREKNLFLVNFYSYLWGDIEVGIKSKLCLREYVYLDCGLNFWY